jgi:hypothetical protein
MRERGGRLALHPRSIGRSKINGRRDGGRAIKVRPAVRWVGLTMRSARIVALKDPEF